MTDRTGKTTSEPTSESPEQSSEQSSEQSPTCTAPDGYRLAYIRTREAWYSQPPLTGIPGDRNVLMISMDSLDGGCRWEFEIDDEPVGGLRVKVYDDAWQAFTDVPEFFTALAALGRGALVEEVVEILDLLGFTDTTPDLPASPHTRERFLALQRETLGTAETAEGTDA